MITKRVGPTEQGQVQGALSSLIALAGIFGPAMYGGSFAYFISKDAPLELPGIPFGIAAGVLLIALVTAWRVSSPRPVANAAEEAA
jgi:DHA1 family tetracycline resistance protein-like MFS transporter